MSKLYYCYYLFYSKVITDDEPHATVIFTLSITESLFVNGIIKTLLAYIICYSYGKWVGIGVAMVIIFVNYMMFYRTGKGKKIVQEYSKEFEYKKLTIFLVYLFSIISISYLFWGSFLERSIIANCR